MMFEKFFNRKKHNQKQEETDSSQNKLTIEIQNTEKDTIEQQEKQSKLPSKETTEQIGPPLSTSLISNLDYIQQNYKDCCDLVVKKFIINNTDIECALVYFEADADVDPIQNVLLTSVLHEYNSRDEITGVNQIKERILPICDVKDITDENTVHQCLLSGNLVLFINGSTTPLFINSKNVIGRSVSTPTMENVVFGAKEAFVENIRINTVLIRQRMRNQHLKIEEFQLGQDSVTTVRLYYLDNRVDTKVLADVQKRIRQLQPTVISSASTFMGALIDKPFSNVELYENSEKPDVVVNKLNEGKFAILIDGFPISVMGPTTFFELFNDIEDYSFNTFFASFVRMLRYLAFLLSLLLAPLYIALTTFHPEMIPTSLYINLAAQRADVPFPTIVEIILMLITFELIRESSIRLPQYISGTVSIVGALAIGQGVVMVGLVTTNALIIVAFTALTSFVFPTYKVSYPLLVNRYLLLFLSTMYGFYGIIIGLFFLIAHLSSIKSFGLPYLSGFSPLYKKALTDTFLRVPIKYLRPKLPYQSNKQGGKHNDD